MYTISMLEHEDGTARLWACSWLRAGVYPVPIFSLDLIAPARMCAERMVMLAARSAYETAQEQLRQLNEGHPNY